MKYGKLTILRELGTRPVGRSRKTFCLCRCDCGREKEFIKSNLVTGTSRSCGHCVKEVPRVPSAIGEKFGKLTVLADVRVAGKSYRWRWRCRCDCGRERVIRRDAIISGNTKTCGECGIKPSGVVAAAQVWKQYRKKAAIRGLAFVLSEVEFFAIVSRNCHYCGRPPQQEFRPGAKHGSFKYNGIDRVDNAIGYTPENAVPCCFQCNISKYKLSQADFYQHIKRIYEYLQLDQVPVVPAHALPEPLRQVPSGTRGAKAPA